MKELISIIVPVYNVEKYVNDCLESIKKQSYSNIEVLLINDGSKDNSEEICRMYCENDSRFLLFTKKNGGLSSARNYGIERAKGEFICFVDSDDVIDSKYVEYLYETIKREKTDIVCCKYKRFKSVDNDFFEVNNIIEKNCVCDNKKFLCNMLYQNSQENYSVSACNKMFKKSIFENARFIENVLFEDVISIDKFLNNANRISIIDNYLYYYRVADNSITTSKFNEKKFVILDHCKHYMDKYFDDKDIYNASINMLFSRSFETLANMKIAKFKDKKIEDEIWNNVKLYRKKILKDKKSRKLAKISVLVSYFGKRISVLMLVLFKKYKEKKI